MAIIRANPDMTSDTTPSGICSASGATNPAWRAFDYIIGDIPWYKTFAVDDWLRYDFDTRTILLDSYVISNQSYSDSAPRMPKDWTIQGSNDGTNWNVLHTVTGETNWGLNESRTYQVQEANPYQMIQIVISTNNGDTLVIIEEFALYENDQVANGVPLTFNGVEITQVFFNNTEVTEAYMNGTLLQ